MSLTDNQLRLQGGQDAGTTRQSQTGCFLVSILYAKLKLSYANKLLELDSYFMQKHTCISKLPKGEALKAKMYFFIMRSMAW